MSFGSYRCLSAMAAGSSMLISSAKDSASPLCGVALASSRASVRGASRRASLLRRLLSPMRLCDSSMTTASQLHVVEVVPVRVALERVDRDDDPLVEGERVPARRDLPLDPLDADRVQPDQRDREPGPQLLLELLEHLLRGHHQDPVAPAAPDQLGEDQPDLQRLAQPHHVREQDAGPEALSARARPGAAGRSAGRAGTGPAAPGRARTAAAEYGAAWLPGTAGTWRTAASRRGRGPSPPDSSSTGFGFSSSVKNTASSSRTSSDTPVARILNPSCSVAVQLRTIHSASRTTIRAPGGYGVLVWVIALLRGRTPGAGSRPPGGPGRWARAGCRAAASGSWWVPGVRVAGQCLVPCTSAARTRTGLR